MTKKNDKNSKFEIEDSKITGNVTVNQEQTSADSTRRTALLGAIGVAGAAGLPSEWKKPIIDGLLLPAHAQMSPTTSTSAITSNTATGTGTSTVSSSEPTMTSTMTSTTSATAIQTSTVTTQGTASRTVLITDGMAACTAITDRTGIGKYYGRPQAQGGLPPVPAYFVDFKYTISNQTVCEDNFSNTTLFMGSSFSYYTNSSFSYGGETATLPTGITTAQTTATAPAMTVSDYTISSSYTVENTVTISGTVTVSG